MWKKLERMVKKAKLSCTGLERPRVLQEIEAPRIIRQSGHKSGNVVSLRHRPPLLTGKDFCYQFLSEAESNPEGLSQ